MNKRIKSKIYIVSIFLLFFVLVNSVVAANLGDWYDNLTEAAGPGGAGYRVDTNDPFSIVALIIQAALIFVGVIFLILAIYGGYLWMTARGNEEQVTRAKNTLRAAVIGLIVVLAAYAISYFVVEMLSKETLE